MSALPLPLFEARSSYSSTNFHQIVQPEADELDKCHKERILALDEQHLENVQEIQDVLISSVNALAFAGSQTNHRSPLHSQKLLGDPTFVPFNTPALTPSNSFPNWTSDNLLSQSPVATPAQVVPPPGAPVIRSSSKFSSGMSSFDISPGSDGSDSYEALNVSASSDPLPDFPLESNPLSSTFLSATVGLGISGVFRKDDSNFPFDGLGRVSLGSSSPSSHWPHSPVNDFQHNHAHFGLNTHRAGSVAGHLLVPDDSTDSLSEMFIQGMLRKLNDDPLHTQLIKSIPDCDSWYELEGFAKSDTTIASVDGFVTSTPLPSLAAQERLRRGLSLPPQAQTPLKLRKHFSSATISSELKRTHSVPFNRRRFVYARPRSASCPTPSSSSRAPGQVIGVRPALSTSRDDTMASRRIWRF